MTLVAARMPSLKTSTERVEVDLESACSNIAMRPDEGRMLVWLQRTSRHHGGDDVANDLREPSELMCATI